MEVGGEQSSGHRSWKSSDPVPRSLWSIFLSKLASFSNDLGGSILCSGPCAHRMTHQRKQKAISCIIPYALARASRPCACAARIDRFSLLSCCSVSGEE